MVEVSSPGVRKSCNVVYLSVSNFRNSFNGRIDIDSLLLNFFNKFLNGTEILMFLIMGVRKLLIQI